MAPIYSIAEGQENFPEIVKRAQDGVVVTIADGTDPVAYVVGRARLDAIVGMIEILANSEVLKAIVAHRDGRKVVSSVADSPP